MSRKTAGAFAEVIALVKALNREDPEAFAALYPRDRVALAQDLAVALDVIRGLSHGNEAILDEIMSDVNERVRTHFPEPEGEL